MLSRRENLLKALKHEPHDRMPVVTVMDSFNYPEYAPKDIDISGALNFQNYSDQIKYQQFCGTDVHIRVVPPCISPVKNIPIEEFYTEDGSAFIQRTPGGELTTRFTVSASAGTSFKTKQPISEPKDYATAAEYFNGFSYVVNENNKDQTKSILKELGGDGIAYDVIPPTPIMLLSSHWVGLEKLAYDMADYPGKVNNLLEIMTQKSYEQCELIAANTPCEVLVFWDDCNSLCLTPKMFKKYSVPVMKHYSEIAHKYGKILVCHTCGKFNAFKEMLLDTNVDAVDWVAPFPFGDIKPAETLELWGNRLTMILSVIPDIFRYGSSKDVEAHVCELLDNVDIDNVIFMLSLPHGTPLLNTQAALRVLNQKYGLPLNELPGIGNLLTAKNENMIKS